MVATQQRPQIRFGGRRALKWFNKNLFYPPLAAAQPASHQPSSLLSPPVFCPSDIWASTLQSHPPYGPELFIARHVRSQDGFSIKSIGSQWCGFNLLSIDWASSGPAPSSLFARQPANQPDRHCFKVDLFWYRRKNQIKSQLAGLWGLISMLPWWIVLFQSCEWTTCLYGRQHWC